MDPKIDAYIRENETKYTREAIREQLIAAGHDPAAVDAGLARFASGGATKSTGRRPARMYVWSVYWICAVGILLFIGLLLSINRNPSHASAIGIFGVAWLAGYLVLGYVIARWLSRRQVPSSAMGWLGIILLTPLAFILIGFGICTGSNALFGPV